MVHLEGKEFLLLGSLRQISGPSLLVPRLESGNAGFEFDDLVLLPAPLIFLLDNLRLQFSLAMLGKKLFSHGEGHRALIQGLIGRVCLLDVVADAKEQKTSLGLIQSDLTNDLIEALLEELFTHRAKSSLSRLSLQQLLVEHFTKACNINTARWLVADLLDEVLALLNPFPWWQDAI